LWTREWHKIPLPTEKLSVSEGKPTLQGSVPEFSIWCHYTRSEVPMYEDLHAPIHK
jgi:hypothetical protein